jgi:hypothetical protein
MISLAKGGVGGFEGYFPCNANQKFNPLIFVDLFVHPDKILSEASYSPSTL